jgi:hypothetical protein
MLPDDKPITVLPGEGTRKPDAWSSQAALTFVLLFGAANLFADMSYEGARSVTGPFLGTLGASGLRLARSLLGSVLWGCRPRSPRGRDASRGGGDDPAAAPWRGL